ncbi:MAG: NAD(P)-binding domain-containing protein [Bacteroidetes bacterium]|nr:NAD(P)-binding domain-containing protein [Bacteroidota bacterium]
MLLFKIIRIHLLIFFTISCHIKRDQNLLSNSIKSKFNNKILINKIRDFTSTSNNRKPEVAIIGAGPAGIVSAKSALRNCLQPIIFEPNDYVGGVWSSKVWNNMRTNISKYTNSFSDFIWSDESDIFPLASDANRYLNQYIEHFKLNKYIQYGSNVINIENKNDLWNITYIKEGKIYNSIFPYVIIATGISSVPYIPFEIDLINNKSFVHSQDYRSSNIYKDKIVAVMGGSYSGIEISADIAKQAKKVYNIITKPFFILPRYISSTSFKKPIPLDLFLFHRKTEEDKNKTFEEENIESNRFLYSLCQRQEEISDLLKMDPNSNCPPSVVISDNYLDYIKSDKIELIKGKCTDYYNNELIINKNKTKEFLKMDALIACTGYKTDLSFLSDDIKNKIKYRPDDIKKPAILYKTVFHPELEGMAFIGLYRGTYWGILEMQARWATRVFSKRISLPKEDIIYKDLYLQYRDRHLSPKPHFPNGDYVDRMDFIAKQIGVFPQISIYKRTDSELYNNLIKNALTPHQFRLNGYCSKYESSRNVIMKLGLYLESLNN